jgi:Tol biopolymer transport system component
MASSAVQSSAVEIVGEGVISTEESQTFPSEDPITGDLWFSVIGRSFDAQTIMVARRTDSGWATPTAAPFSGEWGDRAPRFSPDGSSLYLTSNRPRPGSSEPGDTNVWRVQRTDRGWSAPEILESSINSGAADIHPSITASGIWVASNRDGGMGRSDLYRVGSSGEVVHHGPPLNDELSQPDLWVSPDETWMILAITDHPEGYGGDDLYVSRFADGAWSEPINLGPEINTAEYEYGPWVTADGQYLLFTSHRTGPSHVYRVPARLVHAAMEDH